MAVLIFGEDMRAYARVRARMRACGEDIWGAVLMFGEDMRAYAHACARMGACGEDSWGEF